MKEAEWAKQFHVDDHFGTPTDNFGAQWRFVGLVLAAEAKMQAQYAATSLINQDGLFVDSDGTLDWKGQWILLEAFTDLGELLKADKVPHSTSNRYRDPNAGEMFMMKATSLFDALASRKPADGEELSLAIQSLVWYATYADDISRQNEALARVLSFGDQLISRAGGDTTQRAYRIRGLIEAYRVSDHERFLTAAAREFQALSAEYSIHTGIFKDQLTYRIDDVATIMGALNSLKLFAVDGVDQFVDRHPGSHRQHRLVDHLGGERSEDVHPNDPRRLRVDCHLDQTTRIVDRPRLGDVPHIDHAATAQLMFARVRLLGHPDARHLRRGEHGVGDDVVVDRLLRVGEGVARSDVPLLRRDRLQVRMADHVASGEDMISTGLQVFVDQHVAVFSDLDPGPVKLEQFGVRPYPDRDQDLRRGDGRFLPVNHRFHRLHPSVLAEGPHLDPGMNGDPFGTEVAG